VPEPPGWFLRFDVEEWARAGDDKVRWPGGALMGAGLVAERRWKDACRAWANDNDYPIVEWLRTRREARLAANPLHYTRRRSNGAG
jgi:hypothetical protein